jgi:hypothetical protein
MILVSACNQKGGIFLLDGTKMHDGDTRGLAYCLLRDFLFFATQDGIFRVACPCVFPWKPEQIVKDSRSWHGLWWDGENLAAIDPVHDTIFKFTAQGETLGRYKWFGEGQYGRLHTNDIWIEDGNTYVTCFQKGVCKNGDELGYGKSSQPHSPVLWDGTLFWCASNLGRVMIEGEIFAEVEGFARGLLPHGRHLYVGVSHDRYRKQGCAGYRKLDRDGKAVEHGFFEEAREIYTMISA